MNCPQQAKTRDIKIKKEELKRIACLKKRKLETCTDCVRYRQCKLGIDSQFEADAGLSLMGDIINFALHDMFLKTHLTRLKKSKVFLRELSKYQEACESGDEKNAELHKARMNSWENAIRDNYKKACLFFNSEVFTKTNLDLGYLLRVYKRRHRYKEIIKKKDTILTYKGIEKGVLE